MQWGQQNNLFIGKQFFQMTQTNINTAFIRIIRHYRNTPFTRFQFFSFTTGSYHLLFFLCKPSPDRYTAIKIICPHQNHDGINLFSMLLFQLFCLTGYIIPLTSTHSIHIRSDIQPFFQKIPILFYVISITIGISYRVSYITNLFSIPWMPDITFIT